MSVTWNDNQYFFQTCNSEVESRLFNWQNWQSRLILLFHESGMNNHVSLFRPVSLEHCTVAPNRLIIHLFVNPPNPPRQMHAQHVPKWLPKMDRTEHALIFCLLRRQTKKGLWDTHTCIFFKGHCFFYLNILTFWDNKQSTTSNQVLEYLCGFCYKIDGTSWTQWQGQALILALNTETKEFSTQTQINKSRFFS